MFGLFALANLGFANGAPGTIPNLCMKLLAAPCSATGVAPFPAAITEANCEAILGLIGFAPGDDATDRTQNTLGCRIYWASQATNASTAYNCRYGAISGGGQCGDGTTILDSICRGIVAACDAVPNVYGQAAAGIAACKDATNGLGAINGFWGSKQGNAAANEHSLECRLYHSLVGFSGPAVHCNHTLPISVAAQGWCDGPTTTDTEHYCRTTMNHCGTKAQYNSVADCMNSFPAFPTGVVTTNNTNTQGCRQYHVSVAATGAGIAHCTHGGPTGGTQCGTSHEAWRSMASLGVCNSGNNTFVKTGVEGAFNTWLLTDVMTVVPAATGIGISSNYTVPGGGDNENCRIYHLTVASGDQSHCEHGSLTSSTCFDGLVPAVGAICRMIIQGCGVAAPNGAFADQAACVTAITPILARPGNPNDAAPTGDTVACRTYHAALALALKKNNASVTASCANARATVGPGCGGAPAKSDATALFVSAAIFLPLLL